MSSPEDTDEYVNRATDMETQRQLGLFKDRHLFSKALRKRSQGRWGDGRIQGGQDRAEPLEDGREGPAAENKREEIRRLPHSTSVPT